MGGACALESDGESVTAAVELDSATVFVTVEVCYHIDSLDAEQPYDTRDLWFQGMRVCAGRCDCAGK